MQSTVYNQAGKETGTVMLPESVFGAPWNADLVHQVVVSMQANARTPVAHTHDRGEQRGGGRKPWRQKGTGRARHGSRRSPIWRGGGVTHGPRNEKDYSKKINTKMRTKALYAVLSRKLKDNEIIFVDSLSLSAPKTKDAAAVMQALSSVKGFEALATKKKNTVLVAAPAVDETVAKSLRNIPGVAYGEVRNLNPLAALSYKYVLVEKPSEALDILTAKRGAASVGTSEKKPAVKAKVATAKTLTKDSAAPKRTRATKTQKTVTARTRAVVKKPLRS